MSMTKSTDRSQNTDQIPPALLLARYIAMRRNEVGLTIEQAAWFADLDVRQWQALECGSWIPEDSSAIASIAATLNVCRPQISLFAALSRD
jgi:hypothetical protein